MKEKEKKKRKVDVLLIILCLCLIFALYGAAQIKFFGKRYVNYFGYTVFQVITGSMEPTIMTKDIVVEKITKDVNIDDIVTYKFKDDFITHRVIEQGENYIVTKGDNNNAEDLPVAKEDIVGRVIFVIPKVAIWVRVIKTPQVIIALVLTITIFKILFFSNKNHTNNDNDDKQKKF